MRRMKQYLACLVIVVLMLQSAGCNSLDNLKKEENTSGQKENEQETEGKKAEEIPVYSRSEQIVLDADMDFKALEYFDDAVELYQDEELTNKIYCKYDWNKENDTLSLLPPERPVLNISTTFASKFLLQEFEHSDYNLFDKGESKDWGNLGKMYLVKWLDLQTGEKLEQPEVTEIHITGELDAPQNFQFEVSEHGSSVFSWKPVESAEQYVIVKTTYQTEGISGFYESCDIVAETTDTTWQSETDMDYMNKEFYMDTVEGTNKYYYGVIALNKEGTSMISAMVSQDELAKRLPYCKEESEDASTKLANSIELLSRYQWIRLCDGTLVQYMTQYQIDEAEIVNITAWETETKKMLQVPYIIEGTDFSGSFYVENFDENTYEEELKDLQERQSILKSKMRGVLTNVPITVETKENENQVSLKEVEPEKKESSKFNPTATTKLSRYIASCLLAGEENISVSGIQDGLDEETLTDALYEAYFQNPFIPAIKELSISQFGEEMSVVYAEDKKTREEKQQELAEQVEFVAGELLEEGMSDVNKVLAINAFLCDSVTYDEQAAEQSLEGTKSFTDSMTPYGALIQHTGVCTAYAGAFKLLAEAMGLESIVVTGTLSGNRNHAWNKVKIDGNWCVVDVTSNDGQDIKNIMLNVSDEEAELILKEDNLYLCDEYIGQYLADTDEFEYYRLADKYYEQDKIADAFVKELTYGESAVLRTDATLDNDEFQKIVSDVMERMDQVKMQGYYRLGVIYLKREDG